jgi:hypothetical protein
MSRQCGVDDRLSHDEISCPKPRECRWQIEQAAGGR